MKLSNNNFSKNAYRLKQSGKFYIEGITYTYETRNDIYDITIIDGMKYYQKNMGGYSSRIDSIQPIHYAIENHYNI